MKYKILNYNNNTGTVTVRITNDFDDINTAPVFPITISNLSSVQELEDEIYEVFTIYSSNTPTLPSTLVVPNSIIQHIANVINTVRQLSVSNQGGVQTVTSTAIDSNTPINVQVL